MVRLLKIAALALALLAILPGRRVDAQQFDREVADLVDRFAPQAIRQRQQVHQNPELSNRELRTAELVADHLRSLGLQVRTGIAHTGVIGMLKGQRPGPTIALRADMDALPVAEATDVPFRSTARAVYGGRDVGVSHACGHDVHVAVALGAASILASLRDRLPGTVMFIFQPAEEGAPPGEQGGAELMLAEGVFAEVRPAAVVALHTNGDPPDEEGEYERLGTISYSEGPAYAAAMRWHATVRGRSAHGASPHLSVDPVVTAGQIVVALQTIRSRNLPPLEPSVVTVGIIRGGDRHNIIPSEVELEGTVRTFAPEVENTIQRRMREIFDGITRSAGATFELEFDPSIPVVINNAALTGEFVPVLERIAGRSNVMRKPPETGAEDFSYFSNQVPGFYLNLGVVPPGKVSGGHHTPTFYADDAAVPIGMRIMSTLALDFLTRRSK